jgi:hypothetical protein
MYRRFMDGDFAGAIDLARNVLRENPSDAVAAAIAGNAASRLVDRDHPDPVGEVHDTLPAPRPDTTPAPTPNTSVAVIPDTPLPSSATCNVAQEGDVVGQMATCFLTGDFPRALALAERVLSETPEHALASALAFECRALVERGSSIPVRISSIDAIDSEDRRSRTVLALVDGQASVAEIAKASDLAPLEALKLLDEFVAMGVLRLEPPRAAQGE